MNRIKEKIKDKSVVCLQFATLVDLLDPWVDINISPKPMSTWLKLKDPQGYNHLIQYH